MAAAKGNSITVAGPTVSAAGTTHGLCTPYAKYDNRYMYTDMKLFIRREKKVPFDKAPLQFIVGIDTIYNKHPVEA